MVFSSIVFLFFFLPIVLCVSVALQALYQHHGSNRALLKLTNVWLLSASLVFYGWAEMRLLWVMLASCVLNYVGGARCEPGRPFRRVWLTAVVGANLGLLAYFKYARMITTSAAAVIGLFGHPSTSILPAIVLPLGISFYTFHGISYVVDVYRGKIGACRSLTNYLCYSTLFPQLVAGPIVRYAEVGQFLEKRTVFAADLDFGIRRFVAGLGKKVLIANPVSSLADIAFLHGTDSSPWVAWVGLTAYAIQLYYDFSGYSDMAIGLSRIFGFHFPENFEHPYIATSIRDFWRRWHITLSRFFRDYLYIPLGGSRRGSFRTTSNLILVFALCGLWHGANWTFVVWGGVHGVFLSLEHLWARGPTYSSVIRRALSHVYAVTVVLLTWVLFRADSLSAALAYYRGLFGLRSARASFEAFPFDVLTAPAMIAMTVGVLLAVPWRARPLLRFRFTKPLTAGAYLLVLIMAMLSIGAGSNNPFIYYRF